MHATSLFTNPYAVQVLQSKRSELIEGINNTEHLVEWLVDNGIFTSNKRLLLSGYRTRSEKNARLLDILVSQGERTCRLFFYPCLKRIEPDLYNGIKKYVSDVSTGDVRRQLVGYLLEKDKDGTTKTAQQTQGKSVPKAAVLLQGNAATEQKKEKDKSSPVVKKPKVDTILPSSVFDAAGKGDLSLLEKLLKNSDINKVNDLNETLLHIAAAGGHIHIVKYLIKQGAKLEVRDSKGRSPLHRAAENGHEEVVSVLLQAGSHIYAFDKESKTPLHAAAENKHFNIVKMLLNEEARLYKQRTHFLHMAALRDDSTLVRILLSNDAPVDAKDENKNTALFHAVSHAFENTVRVLLEGGALVDSSIIDAAFNTNNQSLFSLILEYTKGLSPETLVSALFKAVQQNLYRIIAALIDKGTDVNSRNEMQYTALLTAVELGSNESAKVLIEKGSNLDARTPSLSTALHLAVQHGDLSVIRLLLQKGKNPNPLGPEDQTPLHIAAFHNKLEAVDVLIKAGAKVNALTKELMTPLHIACQCGNLEVAEYLINNKASINAKDKQSRTPLHLAASMGRTPTVDLLLKNKADVNCVDKEKKAPLHMAAIGGHLDTVTQLLLTKKARFGAKDMDGCTSLHYAASQGNVLIVKALLIAGKNKNVDDKNVWRKTPLHHAAERGHYEVIEVLLNAGATMNTLDNSRDTPLHCACRGGHFLAVQTLLSWSQDEKTGLQMTNGLAKTPLQVAEVGETSDHHEIVTLLKKKMLLIR
ncbi:CARD- and ANK-domain containing inflammasome adapter protein-like [Protopterus annectens]|uniref:CARD- and ANK-domain containing inflammasome adapter protein-like n=1 Tax=Protopterus annectens TaxID=7888 RepID=UPI001CFB2AA5|nr:CARD- and ANK-domain containing inflammasome adapter protein-like [Protopterus annectens]